MLIKLFIFIQTFSVSSQNESRITNFSINIKAQGTQQHHSLDTNMTNFTDAHQPKWSKPNMRYEKQQESLSLSYALCDTEVPQVVNKFTTTIISIQRKVSSKGLISSTDNHLQQKRKAIYEFKQNKNSFRKKKKT